VGKRIRWERRDVELYTIERTGEVRTANVFIPVEVLGEESVVASREAPQDAMSVALSLLDGSDGKTFVKKAALNKTIRQDKELLARIKDGSFLSEVLDAELAYEEDGVYHIDQPF
jgi:hypothetical protein